MEYNPFQHQDQTISEAMHVWECMHMNNILYFFYVRIKKKKKKQHYQPSQFLGQKSKQTFYFFRPNCATC